MLKAGVFGAGHLGKIHLKLLKESSKYELVGFYDNNESHAIEIQETFGYKFYSSQDALLNEIDVAVIVTPTLTHFDIAKRALEFKKHIFIEKPITLNLEQAEELMVLAKENGVIGAVGHVERYNPALRSVKDIIDNPMFIETHRLSEFNPRGTDVSVVMDLMIHDIEIVLSMISSSLAEVHASGACVLSQSPDIANARLVFKNKSVVNLTASRISLKNMRKTRVFQKDAYISIDFLEKESEIVKIDSPKADKAIDPYQMTLTNAEGETKILHFEKLKTEMNNAILDELENLAEAIHLKRSPLVSLEDGTKALKVALEIISKIKNQLNYSGN
ncbi:MAG: oxidoreductase [Flavobacteriaceae bacterium]|nr:oxidoreductase [Flavobacteriaceae bacterium]